MTDMSDSVSSEVAKVVGEQWSRVMANLVSALGDLGAAEDAAQDAIEVALDTWRRDGIPDNPGAWISTVARRKAIDRIRRDKKRSEKSEQLARLELRGPDVTSARPTFDEESVVNDEQLRLIYGCCHPSLTVETQIALTLRAVAGLTTPEIAAAFLLPEATLAQRLVRAKRKIRDAAVPFKIPDDAELLARTRAVRNVIYLLFNEGYAASGGESLIRADLCNEAIRLGRLVARLLTDDAETFGLVALMLLTQARSPARTTAEGSLVLLADQDRSRWDADLIAEGTDFLDRALRRNSPGPFQIQAAINALHCEAATAESTDWRQIELLYRRWMELAGTPVVELNRLVAVSMVDGPQAALDELERSGLPLALASYGPYWALRADLLDRVGDTEAAAAAYGKAAEHAGSVPEREFLTGRATGSDHR